MMGKKPILGIMIASGRPAPPPKYRERPDEPKPPVAAAHGEPDADEMGRPRGGGRYQVGPEDVEYKAGDLCGHCEYMGQQGNCDKYGFQVEPEGHCEAGFEPKNEPMNGGEEAGEEAMGGY